MELALSEARLDDNAKMAGRSDVSASEQLDKLADRVRQSEENLEHAKEQGQAELRARVQQARESSEKHAADLHYRHGDRARRVRPSISSLPGGLRSMPTDQTCPAGAPRAWRPPSGAARRARPARRPPAAPARALPAVLDRPHPLIIQSARSLDRGEVPRLVRIDLTMAANLARPLVDR